MKQKVRLTANQRRTVIITAAVDVAREKGLACLTMGDVARRCSPYTSERTIYRYFPTKETLWCALVSLHPKQFGEQGKVLGICQ